MSRIFACQVDQVAGTPLGTGKQIEVIGLDSLLGFSAVFSNKSKKFYLVYKGKGDSVGVNKEGLFLTEFNSQLQPVSTRQFLVPGISKLEPTGVVVRSKGSSGSIDSLDIALKETDGTKFNPAVLSVRSNGVVLSYTRIKPVNAVNEKSNTSSLFLLSNGITTSIFLNGLKNKNTTKLIKLPQNIASLPCTQSVTGITNKLFVMSTITKAIDGFGDIGDSTNATARSEFAIPTISDCSNTVAQQAKNNKVNTASFALSPTLFQKGQTTFAITSTQLFKSNCTLTISDAMGIIRLQKTLQPDMKQWQLQLPNLPTGLYYVNISSANEQLYKTTIVVE